MTTYVYETIPTHGEQPEYFEIKQNLNAAELSRHPETGEPIRRVILGGIGVLKSTAPVSKPEGGGCGCGPSGCCD